jgi:hypothetical protein
MSSSISISSSITASQHQHQLQHVSCACIQHDELAVLYTTATTKRSTCCSFSSSASNFTSIPPLLTPSPPDDICRCCPATFWFTRSITKQVKLHHRHLIICAHALAGWADHAQRLHMLGDIMRLTEQFKFESGAP